MAAMLDGKIQARGRWIPWLFVGGFAIIIAVNTVLIVQAVRTFSGLVVEQPYKKGIEYNATVAQLEAQDRLGWTVRARLLPATGDAQVVELSWTDRNGSPLDGLSIEGTFQRPVENLSPVPATVSATGGGRYRVIARFPKPGLWDLHATAQRAGDTYMLVERLQLP